jgi:lantibiotic biosynthesis protein
MFKNFTFHKNLILRSPSLAFQPENFTEDKLRDICNEKWFKEAIYLASPSLYNTSQEWLAGKVFEPRKLEKLLASLSKYYSRMMSRCTPFGLFANCSVLDWREDTKLRFDNNGVKRDTRLDMHFSCALAQELLKIPSIRNSILYFPNTSIYKIGDDLRYVEYYYTNGQRTHQISSVTYNEYLEKLLKFAETGAIYNDMVQEIIEPDISTKEACCFIDEIINSQLLVSDLEPSITGQNFSKQIISTLDKLKSTSEISNILEVLKKIEHKLEKIDQTKSNEILVYQEIIDLIRKLDFDFEENKIFQTDTFNTLKENGLDTFWQKTVIEGLQVLNSLNTSEEKSNLDKFKKRFSERYEDQELPLLEVLDTESGIGYLENTNNSVLNPLIEDLNLPQNKVNSNNIEWNKIEKWLFNILKNALLKDQKTIELKEDDLEDLPKPELSNFPPSLSVFFKIVNDESENKKLILESAGGSSAINILGRFAHGSQEILKITTELADFEQTQNPDVIFAEIIHLPEHRTGNILLHPVFRAYEIPFLGKSSLPFDNQIPLNDLYISVKNNLIVLRSKKLNKIIVPRLSNAHNYHSNALPVYQFLCDLQLQGLTPGFKFNWGKIAQEFEFLPRVSYKNTILNLATWNLKKVDLEWYFYKQNGLSELIKLHKFPRFMVLAQGDNELLIDWTNTLSISTFKDAIKNLDTIQLKEFLYENSDPVVSDLKDGSFINQFISILSKNESTYGGISISKNTTEITRSFSPGSEWLYYKIYCGAKVADSILTDQIQPLLKLLVQKKLIDQWFFIRYNDPDSHLRIRFHLNNIKKTGDVISLFYQYLNPSLESKLIWKIQLDTYNRELERYGFENIFKSEKLFNLNSELVQSFLSQTEGDERENLRWLFGLKVIDELLNKFELDNKNKLLLMENLKSNFAKEFGMDVGLKKQIDVKYRENNNTINELIFNQTKNDTLKTLLGVLEINRKEENSLIDKILIADKSKLKLGVNILDLIASYVHMFINRLIPSHQRTHEMLIYDFLYRTYLSQNKRCL